MDWGRVSLKANTIIPADTSVNSTAQTPWPTQSTWYSVTAQMAIHNPTAIRAAAGQKK